MATLKAQFRDLILLNELEGDLAVALTFSDADGVRSGKSGYSFGVAQFDTKNNSQALKCLKACGFSDAEIRGIVNQTIDVKPLNRRLAEQSDVVAIYDADQLSYCLTAAQSAIKSAGVAAEIPAGVLALADYINQYGSIGPGFKAWMAKLGRPVRAVDVLNFKLLHTKYGKMRPGDCKRRYLNLLKVINRK